MRKLIVLALFSSVVFANEEVALFGIKKRQPQPAETPKVIKIQPSLEIKGGYFAFSDRKMRQIYKDGGFDFQASFTYPLWRWLRLYGSVEYLQCEGQSLHFHQKTKIWEIPLSLGLRANVVISSKWDYYFSLGPRYVFVHQHNDSHFVNSSVSTNGGGGFVNTGFNFSPTSYLIIDLFGEFFYQRVDFRSHRRHVYHRNIQVGGFVAGLGFGYKF